MWWLYRANIYKSLVLLCFVLFLSPHVFFAYLQENLQHSTSRNPKEILFKMNWRLLYIIFFNCKGCSRSSNMFFFINEVFSHFLHLHCAILPTTITHKTYEHLITLKNFLIDDIEKCNTCGENRGSNYSCRSLFGTYCCTIGCSNFALHPFCTMLPHIVKNRWGRHKLVLKYNSCLFLTFLRSFTVRFVKNK